MEYLEQILQYYVRKAEFDLTINDALELFKAVKKRIEGLEDNQAKILDMFEDVLTEVKTLQAMITGEKPPVLPSETVH